MRVIITYGGIIMSNENAAVHRYPLTQFMFAAVLQSGRLLGAAEPRCRPRRSTTFRTVRGGTRSIHNVNQQPLRKLCLTDGREDPVSAAAPSSIHAARSPLAPAGRTSEV